MLNVPIDSNLESQIKKEAAKHNMQPQQYALHLLQESMGTKARSNNGHLLRRREEDTIQSELKDRLRKRGYEWA